jgi:uncharacterized repeat protein (TIGR01451 family)
VNKFMKARNKTRFVPLLVILSLLAMLVIPPMSMAASTNWVDLHTATDFAVMAGSTITNTGSSVIKGNIGLSPGSAVTGFPPGNEPTGAMYIDNAGAIQAQTDLLTAYNDAAAQTPAVDLTGQDLGLLAPLTPGVYNFSSSAQLTGRLTLDGQNQTDPIFVFQIGSTLTTAVSSEVYLENGATPCRVFWQVGSSATLGVNSIFRGTIMANTSITANTGVTVHGRLLAMNAAVTLDTDTITDAICSDHEDIPAVGPASSTATLTVVKLVDNTAGGTEAPSDFNLYVTSSGVAVTDPLPGSEAGTAYILPPGTYAVDENASTGYTESSVPSDVVLGAGDAATITITNTYTPTAVPGSSTAILNVVKTVAGGSEVPADFSLYVKNSSGVDVAGPAAGAASPGTPYTLAAGTYVVGEVASAGYTASYGSTDPASIGGSITLIPGEDATVTITNTYTPTGGGGGTSPIRPMIKVIKTPNPTALTGPGSVTFTYTVTNPGTVTLSGVSVTDTPLGPATYVSGDVNHDNLLEPTETWIYTITTNLDATTTNTATATGSANGLTATNIASVTVVVTSPAVITPVITPPAVTPPVVVTPVAPVSSVPVAASPVVTQTVKGGQMPKTSTPFSIPMYELLLLGVALTLCGAAGWRKRKRYE